MEKTPNTLTVSETYNTPKNLDEDGGTTFALPKPNLKSKESDYSKETKVTEQNRYLD